MKRALSDIYGRLPAPFQQMVDQFRGHGVKEFKKSIYEGLIPASSVAVLCTCGQHKSFRVENRPTSRKVVFVWDPLRGISGSTLMRVQQSAERVRSVFPDLKVFIGPIQSREVLNLNDSILVLSKSVLLDDHACQKLRRNSNILLADYVDGSHVASSDELVDGFVCASFVEHSWTKLNYSKPSFLVPHAVDARINAMVSSRSKDARFNCGYFGHPENGLLVQTLTEQGKINSKFDSIVANESESSPIWMTEALKASAHYIARPVGERGSNQFKPFTKGFLAAHCDAIAIGGRFEEENLHWLGEDYPFLIEEQTYEAAVSAIDQCREAWSGGDISHARQISLKNRQISCPIANAKDYERAISHFS